jgi:diguanylate cyclase (GGDEF)-like protein
MCPQRLLEPVKHNDSMTDAVRISADQFESILNIQQNILDSIAQDHTELDIMNQLCRSSELILDNSVAIIMLLDQKTGLLNLLRAPSIPKENHLSLKNIEPSYGNGSCAAAIHSGNPAYVANASTDPRWENKRELVDSFNACSTWSMPVFNRDGETIGTFALCSFEHRAPTNFHDRLLRMCASAVSILLERKELRRLATIDKLTKLWNRTKLDETLHEQNEKMLNPSHDYSVMLIDIDLFKSVNDNFGHNVGDSVIVELADILRKEVASDGLVGRWGGEEFMVILTKPNSNKAPEIAQRIRQTVQEHRFATVGKITVSVGVCVVAHKTRTIEVIDIADQALYQAKNLGRNRVSVHYRNKPKQRLVSKVIDNAVSA